MHAVLDGLENPSYNAAIATLVAMRAAVFIQSPIRLTVLLAIVAMLCACGDGDDSDASNGAAPPPAPPQVRLNIVSTVPLVHEMVQRIAGDRVDAVCLVQPTDQRGTFDLHAGDVQAIGQADLIFAIGEGYEGPMLQTIGAHAKKEKVILLAEHPQVARTRPPRLTGSRSDTRSLIDPQVYRAALSQVSAALADADPQNAAAYATARHVYAVEIATLAKWMQSALAALPQRKPMVTNDDLAAELGSVCGLTVLHIALETDRQPTEADRQRLLTAVKAASAGVIAIDFTSNATLAEMLVEISKATGASLVNPPIAAVFDHGSDSYLSWMEASINALLSALGR